MKSLFYEFDTCIERLINNIPNHCLQIKNVKFSSLLNKCIKFESIKRSLLK